MIIEGKYELIEQLGEGSFGKIFRGKNTNTQDKVAIKIEKDESGALLRNEARIYRNLGAMIGIPRMRSYGSHDKYAYLVMDLLGRTLEDTLKIHGKLSLRVVILIGIQMIQRIKDLHKNGIIHRDIKPENFIFGKNQDKSLLHIVDFGLAKYYVNSNREHILLESNRKLTGTATYVSLNIHEGKSPSRRDDMESIGYILIYLVEGELPWMNILTEDIIDKKQLSCLWEELQLCPGELITYIKYCRGLDYDSEPNYDYLIGLLKNIQLLLT